MDWALAGGNIPDRPAQLAVRSAGSEAVSVSRVPQLHAVELTAERRRHPRHDLIGHCWIDAPRLTLLGPTHDIGVGGLFVRTAATLELGTPVEVCLHVPGERESLLAQALVARSVPGGFGPPCHGLGLAFVQIAQGQGLLRSLLTRSVAPLG